MHELQIAEQIIEIARGAMVEKRITALEKIELRLGTLSGVDPGALHFCYTAATVDTPLQGSDLAIQSIQPSARCRDCGAAAEIVDLVFRCPSCGSSRLEMLTGQEIEIDCIHGTIESGESGETAR